MHDVLRELLASHPRSKILKLFFRNENEQFSFQEIIDKTQSKPKECKQELNRLASINVLKKSKSRKEPKYFLEKSNPYYEILKKLVSTLGTIPIEDLKEMVKKLGPVKLALASGIFISYPKARADLLIVADDVSKVKLNNFLKRAEAETGKEIDFALMDADEYYYRRNMYDRFIMEFFEKPHEVLIDKVSAGKNLNAGVGRMSNNSVDK